MPSDLQALCLVSRSWRHVATASLYRDVVLDTRVLNSQLLHFEQCLQRGALRNLRYTRSLHLCDFASIFGLIDSSYDSSNEEPLDVRDKDALDARYEVILRVLRLFPEHKLTTFRYVTGPS